MTRTVNSTWPSVPCAPAATIVDKPTTVPRIALPSSSSSIRPPRCSPIAASMRCLRRGFPGGSAARVDGMADTVPGSPHHLLPPPGDANRTDVVVCRQDVRRANGRGSAADLAALLLSAAVIGPGWRSRTPAPPIPASYRPTTSGDEPRETPPCKPCAHSTAAWPGSCSTCSNPPQRPRPAPYWPRLEIGATQSSGDDVEVLGQHGA